MRTYRYTAYDGLPDHGGREIPPMTNRKIKARDALTALARAQYALENYVRTSCEFEGTHTYYVVVLPSSDSLEPSERGFVEVAKGKHVLTRWGTL